MMFSDPSGLREELDRVAFGKCFEDDLLQCDRSIGQFGMEKVAESLTDEFDLGVSSLGRLRPMSLRGREFQVRPASFQELAGGFDNVHADCVDTEGLGQ